MKYYFMHLEATAVKHQQFAEHHHNLPAYTLLTEQLSLMSPEKRLRGEPAPQLSPAFISCFCGSEKGMNTFSSTVFRDIARNELQGSLLKIQ